MKSASSVLVLATVGGIIWVSAGDLNPPSGAVTSTMKTLVEVEPRIAINATNTPGDASAIFKITQPGSYYLVSNIAGQAAKHGIIINSDDVTLDLNGFALVGVPSSLDGITVPTLPTTNVTITNGIVRDWGGNGVNAFSAVNSQLQDLRASNNGSVGLVSGFGSTVTNCTAISNGDDGISGFASTISGCSATSNDDDGIVVSGGSVVTRCTASINTGDGIQAGDNCRIVNNTCVANGQGDGGGIHVTGSQNRIENNHCINARRGLDIDGISNYVAGNTVQGNLDNYDIAPGNQLNILLGEIPESIDWPANVTLAGSLTGVIDTNGLTINADDVTVDLAGHALFGAPDSVSGDGIFMSGRSNVEIRNGTVRDFGDDGIREDSIGHNLRIIGVRAVSNGGAGIALSGFGHLVKDCTAEANVGTGIFVTVGSTVTGNTALSNQFNGISVGNGCSVTGNTAFNNDGDGIFLDGNDLVDQNTAFSNNQSGSGFVNMTSCADCTYGVNHAP